MKIRKGFITNSSSTSYIMCIPDDLKAEDISDEFIRWCIEKEYEGGQIDDEEAKERINEFRERFPEIIEKINKEYGSITCEDGEEYVIIGRLCEKLGFEIKTMDNHPDSGAITNISLNDLKEKIKEIESGEWKNKLKEL